MVLFRLVCSEGGQDPQGQKAGKCLKTVLFSRILCSSGGDFLCRKPKSGIWKTLFGNTVWSVWNMFAMWVECLRSFDTRSRGNSSLVGWDGERMFYFFWLFRDVLQDHPCQRTPWGGARKGGGLDEEIPHAKQFPTPVSLVCFALPPKGHLSYSFPWTFPQSPQVNPSETAFRGSPKKGFVSKDCQATKRSTKSNFLVRMCSGGVGVFHVNGRRP